MIGLICIIIIMIYNFLEFHFIHDVFLTLFRGSPVSLTYNPSSHVYHGVASKCRLLHARYMATPWLSSPHIQTTFLNFHGRPPLVDYATELFYASDGGTFALDWLKSYDVLGVSTYEDDKTPIVIVIPGLTSDSSSAVKYLGEHGEDIPIAGAVAICSPWDLLIGSRFICRRTVQKFYDRALTVGLQEYAQLHQTRYSRLADWDGIVKSRTIRDFDNYATRLVGKYETVDTYYRHCSSAQYVMKVAIPLLCISALDDPVCTWEAIPWDECRANKNIVLAVTRHGGHLAFFEGLTGSRLWWVRAVNEFLGVLHNSPFMHTQKKNPQHSGHELSVDQGPYVNVSNGMVAAISNDPLSSDVVEDPYEKQRINQSSGDTVPDAEEHILACSTSQISKQLEAKPLDVTAIISWLNKLFLQHRRSTWMLFYIATISTLPLLGLALHFLFRKKFKKVLLAKSLK